MIEFLFNFVLELFSIYVSYRFINIFVKKNRKKRKVLFCLYMVYWIGNGMLNFLYHQSWANLISSVAFWIIIVISAYEGSLWKKFLAVFSTVALGMACEDIMWVVLNDYLMKINSDFFGSILAIFLFLIIEILLEKFLHLEREVSVTNFSYFCMLMIPVGSIVIMDIIVKGVFTDKYAQLTGISIIIIINIFVFYLYDKILESYEEKWKSNLLERQVFMYVNQFELIKQSQHKISSFRHDIKHHFMLIGEYARRGMNNELLEYIEQSLNYIDVEKEYVKTGNEEIDCILNYMIDRAKKIGTDVEINIKAPEEKFMSGLDLNILLSNLLENAIEALGNSKDKRLSVCINTEKGIFYISVYNTYDKEILEKKGRFMSFKRSYKESGIGVENINKIVDKYNGEIKINYDENVFKVDIIIFLGL